MAGESYPTARRSKRIPARIPVTLIVQSTGEKVIREVYTCDLSQHGLRIQAHVPLIPGQTVKVIPSEGPRYAVHSRVAWVGPVGSRLEGQAGIEFLNPLSGPG